MNLYSEEDNLLRRYLLDDVTPEERQRVEERLLSEEIKEKGANGDEDLDYIDRLLLCEDELIDDYARGAISASELGLFDQNFMLSPTRREKLLIAQAAVTYAAANQASAATSSSEEIEPMETSQNVSSVPQSEGTSPNEQRRRKWWQALFAPKWKIAVYAMLLVGFWGSLWWFWPDAGKTAEVRQALQQAYREQRPVEARITGFGHAAFVAEARQRGEGQRGSEGAGKFPVDQVALDRAKVLLFGSGRDLSSAAALQVLGQYYLTQKDFETAISQFQQALRLEPDSAQLHSDLGAALLGKIERDRATANGRRREDVDECFRNLNQALNLAPILPEALFNRALLRQAEGLRREARADWEMYLRQDPNSPWAEEARQNLEEVKKELGKAVRRQEQLYQDFHAGFLAGDEARVLQAYSLSFSFNGNYIAEQLLDSFLVAKLAGRGAEAEENLRAFSYLGAVAATRTGDRFFAELAQYYQRARAEQLSLSAQARGLMREANGFYRKSQNDRAVAIYEQARQWFVCAGNSCEALFAEAWIGHCHHQRSDAEQNLAVFARLAPACAERQYRWMYSNALCGLANAHNSVGLFSQAITDCVQCGEIAGELGDQIGKLRSNYLLGIFYYDLGKHEENLRLAEGGQHLADELAADIRYAIPFYNLRAWSLSALGLHAAALAFQQEAVQMAEESKSLRLTAYAYIYQGLLYARQQRFDEAIASAQRGIAIGRELKAEETGQDFVHLGLLQLGHIYRAAGKLRAARAAFNQVMEFFQHSKRQVYFYGASKGRLLTSLAQKDDSVTQAELEQVIALYEQYRKGIQEESNRNAFFDQEQSIYDIAIDFAYTRLGNPQQALAYAELCRARSLLDVSRRGWELIHGPEAPDLHIKAGVQPRTIDEIRLELPHDVQLLEYAVLEDKLVIWLITKTGVESRVLQVHLAELNERIRRYLALVEQQPGKADHRWRANALELHDLLLQPIEALLDKRKLICIIPDKLLTRLPFGTLIARSSGRLLTEDYLLSYAASANLFLDSTENARRKEMSRMERLLAVGNPRFESQEFPELVNLPSAEKEAAGVASNYKNATLLTAARATKETVLREIKRADVVHLALHYVPAPWSPMSSRIPLATGQGRDGKSALQVYEIYALATLSPRLVVLSACQTRGEGYYGGEGAVGISRPFEAAGVPLVVASLWPVDSEATMELMLKFHHARKQLKYPTASALRSAQLEMLYDRGGYRHPYYWAAFVTVGGHTTY